MVWYSLSNKLMIKFLNKKFLALLILSVIFFSQAGFVFAGDLPDGGSCKINSDCINQCCCCGIVGSADSNACVSPENGVCGRAGCNNIICPFSSHRSLYSLITTASDYVFYIGLILAPLMIVVGAFLFMASGGSPERTQLGKKIITWSLIGLAFILFAKGIGSILGDILFG